MNAEKIKEAREYLGFSFANEMADALGVDKNTYYKWENGKRNISAVGVRAIEALVFIKDAGKLQEFLSVADT